MPNDEGQQHREKVRERPRRNGWKVATLVLFISTVVFATTTLLAYDHIINPPVTRPTLIATQQTNPSPANNVATSIPVPSPATTPQTGAPVASGTITENLQLTCGTNCNDPIRVTITTIQVNDADGNMIWNVSLENVTGSSLGYGINTFELLASGTQNQIPATFSEPNGTLTNSDPVSIQGTFAFVPTQNTTYTLTVILGWSNGNPGSTTFNPAQITF